MKHFLGIILILTIHGAFGNGRFYENNIRYKYDCSVKFDYPRRFDCACISGLWKFSGSSCKDVQFVAGENQYCFQTGHIEVTRVEQLLKDKKELVIHKSNGELVRWSESLHSSKVPFIVSPKESLITGSQWEFVDDTGIKFCLDTTPQSYCFFSTEALETKSVVKIRRGCNGGVFIIAPKKCVAIQKENKNICEHHRVKRSDGANETEPELFVEAALTYDEDTVDDSAPASGGGGAQGGNKTAGGNGTAAASGSESATTNEAMASELWNFMDSQLYDILELKEPFESDDADVTVEQDKDHRSKRAIYGGKRTTPRPKKYGRSMSMDNKKDASKMDEDALKTYKSPVYQFLELSKEIMKKTCPPEYVNPEFFNLTVTVFINLQKKHFKFPEAATNYQGFQRIIDSFNACIENATVFNFTTESCPTKDKPVSGTYCAFDNCSMEINMMGGFEDFDPIIETVWNIFKNAHSYCFNFFDKNYNDHHRFTTWMIPLFENEINDIWRNGTAKGLVYGGVFGDQIKVQTAVAYCTASSQMTTKYPWDLPRPDKIEELSKPASNRRKRYAADEYENYEADDMAAECITSHSVHQCD